MAGDLPLRWTERNKMKRTMLVAFILGLTISALFSSYGYAEQNSGPADYKQRTPPFTLDKNVELKILKKDQSIVDIQYVEFATSYIPFQPIENQIGFDLMDLRISIAGDFEFEGVWHGRLLVRKLVSESDWSNCEVFYVIDNTPFISLSRMSKDEMGKHLKAL